MILSNLPARNPIPFVSQMRTLVLSVHALSSDRQLADRLLQQNRPRPAGNYAGHSDFSISQLRTCASRLFDLSTACSRTARLPVPRPLACARVDCRQRYPRGRRRTIRIPTPEQYRKCARVSAHYGNGTSTVNRWLFRAGFLEGGIVLWKPLVAFEHVVPIHDRQAADLDPPAEQTFLSRV